MRPVTTEKSLQDPLIDRNSVGVCDLIENRSRKGEHESLLGGVKGGGPGWNFR